MPVAKPTAVPRWASLSPWAPTTFYTVGERVTNDGGKIYQCVTAGTSDVAGGPTGNGAAIVDGTAEWDYQAVNAPAWAALTAYAVGARVTNGGNLYQCTVAGTSAAAGGPSGTGTDIVDATVRWLFIASAEAVRTDAPALVRDTGNLPGGKPRAQYWNHWQWVVYRWLLWVQDLTVSTQSWVNQHVFVNTVQHDGPLISTSGYTALGTGAAAAVDAKGGGGGPAVRVREQAVANLTPQADALDLDGNRRWILDHNGLPSGRVSELREEWILPSASYAAGVKTEDGRWLVTADGAGTVQPITPDATGPHRSVSVSPAGLLGDKATATTSVVAWHYSADGLLVLSWEARLVGSINDLIVAMGLSDNAYMQLGGNYARLIATSPGGGAPMGSWFAQSQHDADVDPQQSTDTAVVPSTSLQRFRIEIRGANLSGGAAVKFYINNTLKASHATRVPTNGPLFVGFSVERVENGANTLNVGPVLAVWPRQLHLADV